MLSQVKLKYVELVASITSACVRADRPDAVAKVQPGDSHGSRTQLLYSEKAARICNLFPGWASATGNPVLSGNED